jgi:hypothetical protein
VKRRNVVDADAGLEISSVGSCRLLIEDLEMDEELDRLAHYRFYRSYEQHLSNHLMPLAELIKTSICSFISCQNVPLIPHALKEGEDLATISAAGYFD